MNLTYSFEKFLIGDRGERLPQVEYKRVMLTGYLAFVSVLVSVVYASIDWSHAIFYSVPAYVLLICTSLLVFWLIRKEKYTEGKVLLMANANLVVFYSVINDPPAAGTYMLFIPAGTGSFAILGFHEKIKSISLAIFSAVLLAVAFFGEIHLQQTPPSELYVKLSFAFNFTISLSVTVSVLYFLGSLNEASEKELYKKEEAEREKNDQLVKINEELDRFIYSVSHDLRSPLSSVQGLVALGKISSDEEEMKKCFTLIGERIKAQEFFINEIIDIYRNNRVELKLEKIQLRKLIEEIVEETSFTPGVDDIRFKIEINDDLEFVSDKIRLKSLMFNLIGNAIKYHDPNKTNKFIKVSATRSEEVVIINIEDNGKGIGEEHLPKIFNMFYRASTDSKGSGLGLYIVKEAVAKLKGTITAESTLGKGTQFTLRFSID